jgi:hypothetical protein
MELPGVPYLYTLAALSMTFVGFCAIVIVLRQTIGKEISGWHIVLMRLYIETGFWAAAFSMLPPLLALCGLPHTAVWRASSTFIAVVMVGYGVAYPRRRRSMTADPVPLRRWLPIVTGSLLVIVGLLCNAVGAPFEPSVAPVAIAATWTLVCGAGIFLLALTAFWHGSKAPDRP